MSGGQSPILLANPLVPSPAFYGVDPIALADWSSPGVDHDQFGDAQPTDRQFPNLNRVQPRLADRQVVDRQPCKG